MNQSILCQRNGSEALFSFLEQCGAKKMLLVCDQAFPFLKLAKAFAACPIPYVVFDQFCPNPLYEDACKGVELFRKEACDAIVAIGGGSTMDVAKCIKLFCTMDSHENYLKQEFKENQITLVAVPTTSGTGSESTRFAVIYDHGMKQSISSPAVIPQLAILDADVLDTVSLYQKKCTMMDALCQAIESWWSIHSTEESRNLSKQAVQMILDAMDGYLNNQPEENEAMLRAANLAGQAINITQTTAAHAMSYKLTSIFGLPHGRAVAVCLPDVWQYMLCHPERCADPRGEAYLLVTLSDISRAIGCSNPQQAPKRMTDFYVRFFQKEEPENFRMEELDCIVESVNVARLKNNPVTLDKEAIRRLYRDIFQTYSNQR